MNSCTQSANQASRDTHYCVADDDDDDNYDNDDENDDDDDNDDENDNDNDNDDDCPRYQLLLKDLSSSSTNALTGRWLHTYKPDFK